MNNQKIGILLGVLESFAVSILGLMVHDAKDEMGFADILLYRSMFIMCALLPFLAPSFKLLVRKESGPIWLRSVFGGFGIYCLFYNFQHTSVTMASLLAALNPFFVIGISAFAYEERVFLRQYIAALLAVTAAVILYTNGPIEIDESSSLWIGLLGALSTALGFLSLRSAAKTFPPLLIVFSVSLMSAIISISMGADLERIFNNIFNLRLFRIGILALIVQILLTYTYKFLRAPIAATVTTLNVVFALGLEVLLGFYVIKGSEIYAVLVIVGCIILIRNHDVQEKGQAS